MQKSEEITFTFKEEYNTDKRRYLQLQQKSDNMNTLIFIAASLVGK